MPFKWLALAAYVLFALHYYVYSLHCMIAVAVAIFYRHVSCRDLPTLDMFSPIPTASQWLTTLPPLTSSFSSCQQPPSPLQLSSPCTPSGSNSRSSGYAGTPVNFPPVGDPYYNPPVQDNYQQMFDNYQSIPYQPTR